VYVPLLGLSFGLLLAAISFIHGGLSLDALFVPGITLGLAIACLKARKIPVFF
jgi:hypothetical protein